MSASHDLEKALPECQGKRDEVGDASSVNVERDAIRHEEEEDIQRIPTVRMPHLIQPRTPLHSLAKTITARSNASITDPGPPPDGGAKAWTQAFMGHFVVFNTWGMIATFGVFQQHYTSDLGLEPSAVSWIGSMQMLGHFSLGMLTGRMFDAGYFYWSIIPGMLLSALGIFMTSLCSKYWHFFLAQGLMNGFGNGMQFAPTLSLVGTYFTRNRSVALAIMASGSATGGLVYPTIARQLLPKIGFPWTVRIMGFIMLATGSLYCSLLKPRLPPRKSGPVLELKAFQEAPYSLFLLAVFMICLGQYFAFYYIASYATNILGLPYGTAINVLLVLNGVGIFGRLVPSYFADKYVGAYNMLIPFCFTSAVVLFCWPLVEGEGGLYGWAISYGFFVAGFQGMFPAVLTSLTRDMSRVGTRNGMGLAIIGLGTLVGPPIAGALIQNYGGSYLIAQMFGGATVLLGSVILVIGRISITGNKFMIRA
ncbi:major facilitator superfamily domain-containing protein [Paraphoma chrysanthemicola]|uniref:Major facilitator superfamily domain-containing protein n=1 Tax=Paraphoma chrysanthemicola TaxID=798071 RepID=A0A8K0VVQ1_9PLEO|nr:major facilitator superfamily domain-containing protein [Paraphoma chrysanthemicola]